jgi:hypothetical protein
LIIGDRDHEPGDEGGEGKQLPEKPSKKASQAEQGDDTEKNQIHPVHGRKPFNNMRDVMQTNLVKAVRPVKDFALRNDAVALDLSLQPAIKTATPLQPDPDHPSRNPLTN